MQTKKIRKAIIPAAGLGTRMLPISYAVPKEMLPIVDLPAIYHLVKEAVEGLRKCTGMLRHHLAMKLNLRITPELNFIKDGSIEHGAKIARLLEEIHSGEKSDEQ